MKQNIRKDNRGSTLLLTMVAIAFITILGVLIMSVTAINIQMKQVDYQSKKNFYKTESPMDEIRAKLAVKSSDWLKEAYKETMDDYEGTQNSATKSFKGQFDKSYEKKLVGYLANEPYVELKTNYTYKTSAIRLMMNKTNPLNLLDDGSGSNQLIVKFKDSSPSSKGEIESIVLKDVKVSYKQNGYENKVKTDISFEIPDLAFDGSNLAANYLSYALIGNQDVQANGAGTNVNVTGDVYGGLNTTGGNVGVSSIGGATLNITGENLITRGDISVENGATLNISPTVSSTMDVWTRNIQTKRGVNSDKATLNIKGNCNVEDDLVLNAKKSDVTIKGTYNGFSYGKITAAPAGTVLKSQYSSAVLVNGTESTLDLSNLSSMSVAGRAFISRQEENGLASGVTGGDDIMLGESVTVKSDQSMYLVDNEEIKGGHNPLVKSEFDKLLDMDALLTIPPEKMVYLDASNPVTTYYYIIDGVVPDGTVCYLYYNFKNQKSANDYFNTYCDEGKTKEKAKMYLDKTTGKGIFLPAAAKIDVSAHALQFNGTGSVKHKAPSGDPDSPSAEKQNSSILTAMKYKSKELELKDSVSSVNSTNYRFSSDDKQSDPLFNYIIDKNALEDEAKNDAANCGFTEKASGVWVKSVEMNLDGVPGDDGCVYFVYNTSDTSLTTITGTIKKGIVVATGNININCSFDGLIISNQSIIMNASTTINADPTLLAQIFSYAVKQEEAGGILVGKDKRFTHYFNAYKDASSKTGEDLDDIDVLNTISYSNWRKE